MRWTIFAGSALVGAAWLALGCGGAAKDGGTKNQSKAEPAALTAKQPGAAQAEPAGPTCDSCRERHCSNYRNFGVDLVAGCFEHPDPKLAKDDPTFAQDCTAAVRCAVINNCGYTTSRGPSACYCGPSKQPSECIKSGPGDDAPCAEEWRRATRAKSHEEVVSRFDKYEYPSGWAFALIECDRDFCGAKSRDGRCTP